MRFLSRWFAEVLSLGLCLTGAVLAMQAPALTREYAAALQQVAQDARRDIDAREATTRAYYRLAAPGGAVTARDLASDLSRDLSGDPSGDEALIAALRPVEPANAQGLQHSIAHMQRLREAYDRIAATTPLLQPVRAALDVARDAVGDLRLVLRTVLDGAVLQLVLTQAAGVYALAGLVLGSLLAQAMLGTLRNLGSLAAWRRLIGT
jgi:hypothetical protein